MTSVEPGRFVYTTCQVGAEAALKKELGREHPELRFAFSRPGFVTFKLSSERAPLGPDFALRSVFARCHGLSLGPVGADALSVDERARQVLQAIARRPRAGASSPSPVLHVWERDRFAPGEEPLDPEPDARTRRVVDALHEQATTLPELAVDLNSPATPGQLVHDLVLVEDRQWWAGVHRHGPGRSPHPGGRPDLCLPADAPSRAYLKLEEGLQWCGAGLHPGDTAVEIGSAPGGASYALLQRGLRVVGIDPAVMHPGVLAHPHFVHIARSFDTVRWEDLPHPVHWLLLDMNVPPRFALRAVQRLFQLAHDGLLGLLLTFKLNQWQLADQIPGLLRQLRAMGLEQVSARQLAHNRQEFFVSARTAAGRDRRA
ncbi:MAG: SAM-dependent methyltransferase [Pseudomonadota bacterium]